MAGRTRPIRSPKFNNPRGVVKRCREMNIDCGSVCPCSFDRCGSGRRRIDDQKITRVEHVAYVTEVGVS
jgi:hypothetical protein